MAPPTRKSAKRYDPMNRGPAVPIYMLIEQRANLRQPLNIATGVNSKINSKLTSFANLDTPGV